jgi:hypothetical protein
MAITYFGDETTTVANWDTGDSGIAFGLLRACPLSGTPTVKELGAYLKNSVGNVRLALFNSSKAFVCQGNAEIAVGVEGWHTHTSFTNQAGSPITPTIIAGDNYYIVASFDSSLTNVHYASGGSTYYQLSSDYTGGYPATLTFDHESGNTFTLRCGVEEVASGVSVPTLMASYRRRRT